MISPIAMPITVPTAICITKNETSSPKEVEGSVNSRISAIVSTTAIGSLLPDSNSSNWINRGGILAFRARSTMKTAAASVVDTIAPSKRPSRNENPWTQETNTPTSSAVMQNPDRRERQPLPQDGTHLRPLRVQATRKQNQDERNDTQRLHQRRIVEMMPPRPSDPANMPIARNKTSAGMPNRFESLIVKMLRMTRVEKTMKINSMEVGILLFFFRRCSTRSDAVYSTDGQITLPTK